jgi:5,10-methylenetetrahydromethanopterin reductase
MRFGIRFIEYVGSSHELVRLSAAAEEAGFDSVWFPHDPYMRNTWVLTSAVACQTSRIEIGSVGTNPYTTDPSEIATYLATLDELSDGRALLGLGLHATDMVEWSGVDASDYMTRTEEATELIRRLLNGEVAEFAGEAFNWSDQCYLRFEPRRDTIPVYISAFGPDYLELSGRIGDGSMPMITPPASAATMVPPIQRGLEQNPRAEKFVISGCAWLSMSETREAAAANMRKMVAYFGPYFEVESLAQIGLTSADFQPLKALVARRDYEAAYAAVTDDMLRLGIVGTPDEVIREIEMLADLGVNEVNLGGPLGPDPMEAIRLMGNRVIPYFRG